MIDYSNHPSALPPTKEELADAINNFFNRRIGQPVFKPEPPIIVPPWLYELLKEELTP